MASRTPGEQARADRSAVRGMSRDGPGRFNGAKGPVGPALGAAVPATTVQPDPGTASRAIITTKRAGNRLREAITALAPPLLATSLMPKAPTSGEEASFTARG